jgi:hypothetical protein
MFQVDRWRPQTRIACQAVLIVIVTLSLSHLFQLAHGYWSTLTGLLILGGSLGAGVQKGLNRAAMTVVGCVVGWAIYHLLPYSIWVHLGVMLCAMFLIFYDFSVSYRGVIVGITLLILFMFVALGGWDEGLLRQRVLETVLGVAVAALISYRVLPVKASCDLTARWEGVLTACRETILKDQGVILKELSEFRALAEKSVFENWFDARRRNGVLKAIAVLEGLEDPLMHYVEIAAILKHKMRSDDYDRLMALVRQPLLERLSFGHGEPAAGARVMPSHMPTLAQLVHEVGDRKGVCEHPVLLTGLQFYGERLEYLLDQSIVIKEKLHA